MSASGGGPQSSGGHHLVPLRHVVHSITDRCYEEVMDLQSDLAVLRASMNYASSDKNENDDVPGKATEMILRYLKAAKLRFLKASALLHWWKKSGEEVEKLLPRLQRLQNLHGREFHSDNAVRSQIRHVPHAQIKRSRDGRPIASYLPEVAMATYLLGLESFPFVSKLVANPMEGLHNRLMDCSAEDQTSCSWVDSTLSEPEIVKRLNSKISHCLLFCEQPVQQWARTEISDSGKVSVVVPHRLQLILLPSFDRGNPSRAPFWRIAQVVSAVEDPNSILHFHQKDLNMIHDKLQQLLDEEYVHYLNSNLGATKKSCLRIACYGIAKFSMHVLLDKFVHQAVAVAQITAEHSMMEVKQSTLSEQVLVKLQKHGIHRSTFISHFILNGGKLHVHKWKDCQAVLITLRFNTERQPAKQQSGSSTDAELHHAVPSTYSVLDEEYYTVGTGKPNDPGVKRKRNFQRVCEQGFVGGEFYEISRHEQNIRPKLWMQLFSADSFDKSDHKSNTNSVVSESAEILHILLHCQKGDLRDLVDMPRISVETAPYRSSGTTNLEAGIDDFIGSLISLRQKRFQELFCQIRNAPSGSTCFSYALEQVPVSVTACFSRREVDIFPHVEIENSPCMECADVDCIDSLKKSASFSRQRIIDVFSGKKQLLWKHFIDSLLSLHVEILSQSPATSRKSTSTIYPASQLRYNSACLHSSFKKYRWMNEFKGVFGTDSPVRNIEDRFNVISEALYGENNPGNEWKFVSAIIAAWVDPNMSRHSLFDVFSVPGVWADFDGSKPLIHFATRFTRLLSVFHVVSILLATDSTMLWLREKLDESLQQVKVRRRMYESKIYLSSRLRRLANLSYCTARDSLGVEMFNRSQSLIDSPDEKIELQCFPAPVADVSLRDDVNLSTLELLSLIGNSRRKSINEKVVFFESTPALSNAISKLINQLFWNEEIQLAVKEVALHATKLRKAVDPFRSRVSGTLGITVPLKEIKQLKSGDQRYRLIHSCVLESIFLAVAAADVSHVCIVDKSKHHVTKQALLGGKRFCTFCNFPAARSVLRYLSNDDYGWDEKGPIHVWGETISSDQRSVSIFGRQNSMIADARQHSYAAVQGQKKQIIDWACKHGELRRQRMKNAMESMDKKLKFHEKVGNLRPEHIEKGRKDDETDPDISMPEENFPKLETERWRLRYRPRPVIFVDILKRTICSKDDANAVPIFCKIPQVIEDTNDNSRSFEIPEIGHYQPVSVSISLKETTRAPIILCKTNTTLREKQGNSSLSPLLISFEMVRSYLEYWQFEAKDVGDGRTKLNISGDSLKSLLRHIPCKVPTKLDGLIDLTQAGLKMCFYTDRAHVSMAFSTEWISAQGSSALVWLKCVIIVIVAAIITHFFAEKDSSSSANVIVSGGQHPYTESIAGHLVYGGSTRALQISLENIECPFFPLEWSLMRCCKNAKLRFDSGPECSDFFEQMQSQVS